MEPYLGNAANTVAVLRSHGISARKKYGQNFLIDPAVLKSTVEAAGVSDEDCVLEIGPGIGTLTQYLASRARRVIAVEIDRSLESVLRDTLSGWPNVRLIWGDILKLDVAQIAEEENEGKPMKVAANLPYYITTPIVLQLLENADRISDITVMVQKEVADRMLAGPGTKEYGALTLAVQYYASPKIVRVVHPSSFLPQPAVDSAVVHLSRYSEPPVRCEDPKLLFAVIRASFNQRRKKLVNGLVNYAPLMCTKEQAEQAVARCGLRPDVRGETLTLEEFAALSDALTFFRNLS